MSRVRSVEGVKVIKEFYIILFSTGTGPPLRAIAVAVYNKQLPARLATKIAG